MGNRQFQEKDEKDEKEVQKHEEKTMEEKWRRDPLSAIVWAVILIWAGVVFLADNLGWLNNLFPGGVDDVWALIMLGVGVILLGEVLARVLVPAYSRPVGGTLILAFVFIGVGLGNLFDSDIVLPLALIAVGIAFLLGGFLRRKA